MKNILLALIILPFSLLSQDIISEEKSISTEADTVIVGSDTITPLYFLTTTLIVDNGTNFPDTIVSRNLFQNGSKPADSTEVARQLKTSAINGQNRISGQMARVFKRGQANTDFNDYRDLFLSVTSVELYTAIEDDFFNSYDGRYRVYDLIADSNFVANLIRVGVDDRYRLEHETTGQRWTVLPKSRKNFRLNQWNGLNYDLYWDEETRPDGKRIYQPTERVLGVPPLRIVKLAN